MEDFAAFMEKYPHNTDCGDKFLDLVQFCYTRDDSGDNIEEFIERCLEMYGGTVAGAMIEWLKDHVE